MKIPNTLPVTAELSRAARFQLGLTQAALIQKSDLPGWKLKQFETGRFVPDIPFLQGLREFYTSQDIEPPRLSRRLFGLSQAMTA